MSAELTSVLLAGGGTAGHVSPLLALADRLTQEGVGVTALGTTAGLEARIVPERGFDLRFVPRVPLPRRLGPDLLAVPGRLRTAVRDAGRVIDEVRAQVVVGFGGYVSAPAYLAARRRRIPVVVHEGNARPGVANRLGARLASQVALTFPGTPLAGGQVIGMPLRTQITNADLPALRARARAHFGLPAEVPTLLVTGGSLGAQRINDAVAAAAADLTRAGLAVLHVTGEGKHVDPVGLDSGAGPADATYVQVPYVDRMELAYAASDLVLGRAGANTVCELTALGLPAVYVPLPIGNGEQRLNAAGVVANGGGVLVADADLDAAWLSANLVPLATSAERLSTMATAAAEVGVRDADARLADLVRRAHREAR